MLTPHDLHTYDLLAKFVQLALWGPAFVIGVIAILEDLTRRKSARR